MNFDPEGDHMFTTVPGSVLLNKSVTGPQSRCSGPLDLLEPELSTESRQTAVLLKTNGTRRGPTGSDVF